MASAAAITPFFDRLMEPELTQERRGDRSSEDERAAALREILSGSDPKAVADALQRSPRTVRAWLNAHEQEEQVRKLEGRVAQLRSALREERPRFAEIIDSYIQNNIRPRAGSDSIYVTTNALAPYCLRRAVLDVKYRLFAAERTLEDARGMMIGTVIELLRRCWPARATTCPSWACRSTSPTTRTRTGSRARSTSWTQTGSRSR